MKKLNYKKLIKQNTCKGSEHEDVIKAIKKAIGSKADVVLGGSLAKGTALQNYDIDLFVRFYNEVEVDLLEKALKKQFKNVERVHGSRDYFSMDYKGVNYEIIPVLKIDSPSKAENITDVSYFHIEWVKNNLQNPEQVKIAKLFAKANGVYGAESYINGFSGYILELLVAHYGSFENLVEEASKWRPKVIVDVAKHYKSREEVLKKMNESKLQSPLIVVDPVDKNRNASAALSEEIFSKFVLVCRDFVDKPSLKCFDKKDFSIAEIKRRAKKYDAELIALKIKPFEDKKDIAYTKAFIAFKFIRNNLVSNDFDVVDSGYEFDEDLFWYLVLPKRLSLYKKHLGPKVWAHKENVNAFESKYKDIFLEGNSLAVMKKREFVIPKELVKKLSKMSEVKSRVKMVNF